MQKMGVEKNKKSYAVYSSQYKVLRQFCNTHDSRINCLDKYNFKMTAATDKIKRAGNGLQALRKTNKIAATTAVRNRISSVNGYKILFYNQMTLLIAFNLNIVLKRKIINKLSLIIYF